jgi:hypothetical protein
MKEWIARVPVGYCPGPGPRHKRPTGSRGVICRRRACRLAYLAKWREDNAAPTTLRDVVRRRHPRDDPRGVVLVLSCEHEVRMPRSIGDRPFKRRRCPTCEAESAERNPALTPAA